MCWVGLNCSTEAFSLADLQKHKYPGLILGNLLKIHGSIIYRFYLFVRRFAIFGWSKVKLCTPLSWRRKKSCPYLKTVSQPSSPIDDEHALTFALETCCDWVLGVQLDDYWSSRTLFFPYIPTWQKTNLNEVSYLVCRAIHSGLWWPSGWEGSSHPN